MVVGHKVGQWSSMKDGQKGYVFDVMLFIICAAAVLAEANTNVLKSWYPG